MTEKEYKPNPLLDLIHKAQTIDELKQLFTKYENSLNFAVSFAFVCRERDIRLNNLQERVSKLEEKMGKEV